MPSKRTSGEGGFEETGLPPLLRFFPFCPDRSWYEKYWYEGADDWHRAHRLVRLAQALGQRLLAAMRQPVSGLTAWSNAPRQRQLAAAPNPFHAKDARPRRGAR
jgi:hypothetical protein